MSKDQLVAHYNKMSTAALINTAAKGGLQIKEAAILAAILDHRCPKPQKRKR